MSGFFVATLCVIGVTSMIVGAKKGPPAVFREWMKSLHAGADWKTLWDCGMCVSFWAGLLLCPVFASVLQGGAEFVLLPLASPGFFYMTEKLKTRG